MTRCEPSIERHNQREYGLDLFRIVSMLLVLCLHILGHGGLLASLPSGTFGNYLASQLQILAYPGVDCFVLLSGYLLSDGPVRLPRIIKLWATVVFWSIVIQCGFFATGAEPVTLGRVVYMFLPILSGRYWFVNAYIILMLAAPALNHLLRTLEKQTIQTLLLTALTAFMVMPLLAFGNDIFGVQNGYHFSWFCVLYLLGGYLKRYGVKCQHGTGFWACGYLLMAVIELLLVTVVNEWTTQWLGENALVKMFLKSTSPFICAEAICLFLCFRALPLKAESRAAGWAKAISPLVFSVYLIHDHPLIREHFILNRFSDWADLPPLQLALQFIGVLLGIFFVCVLADFLRNWLFRKLKVEHLCQKTGNLLTNGIHKLLSFV